MPWTNDDIRQLMGLLTEIKVYLTIVAQMTEKHYRFVSKELSPWQKEYEESHLKKKIGRPKGSKNVKQGRQRLGKVRRKVHPKRLEGNS